MGKVREGGKTKITIFGSNKEEGLIIRGAGNYFTTLIGEVEKICKDSFSSIKIGAISNAEINAKKGTLHEQLTGFMVNLRNLITSDDKDSKEKLITEIVTTLKNAKEITDYLVKQLGEVSLSDYEEHLSTDLAVFENELLNDNEKLKTFIKSYYVAMSPFLEKMNADTLVQAGSLNRSGGREDSFFTYKDEESAKKASKYADVRYYEYNAEEFINNSQDPEKVKQQLLNSGFDLSKPLYAIGHGQKLYSNFKSSSKVGEFNSITRLFDALLDQISLEDKYFDPGFSEEINRRFPISEDSKSVINDLRNDLNKVYEGIVTNFEFSDPTTNSVKKVSGFGKNVVKLLKNELNYETFTDDDNELAKSLDEYEDTDSDRKVLAEILSRQVMNKKLKDFYDSNPKEAKNLLLRMGFVVGGNSREMVQGILSETKKEHKHFSHNKVFDYLKNNIDDLDISFTGNGFTFKVNNVNMGSVKQSGTWRRSKTARYTRTEFQVSSKAEDIASEEANNSSMENSSKLSELLTSQIDLLNEILNQTKNS